METLYQAFTHDIRERQGAQRTARRGVVTVLVALMIVGVAAVPVSAGPQVSCPTAEIQPQCIGNVKITPHGTFADFSFFTTSAKISTVQVSWVAPKKLADGTYSYSGLSTVAFAMSPAVNQHWVQIPDLWPGSTYHFLINAEKGPIGNDAQLTGTFATLKRHVDVNFTSIHVTDDSDTWGAGELTFFFFVNDWLKDFPSGYLTYPRQGAEADVSSGDTIDLMGMYRAGFDNVPDTLLLQVLGRDDDCGIGFPVPLQLCEAGQLGPGVNPPSGSNSDWDWATASTNINVAVSGPGEAFQTTTVLTTSAYSLKFEVSVTIHVTYV